MDARFLGSWIFAMAFDSSMGHIVPLLSANQSGYYEGFDFRELGLTSDNAMDSRKVLLNLIENIVQQIAIQSDKPTSFNVARAQIQAIANGTKFRQVYTVSFDFDNDPTRLDLANDL